MRYHNINISCSIKPGIELDTIILKIKCYEKWSRSCHEIANTFFLPDLLKCDPQAGEGSVKFTEVSEELNSRQRLSEDYRLMAALTPVVQYQRSHLFWRSVPTSCLKRPMALHWAQTRGELQDLFPHNLIKVTLIWNVQKDSGAIK